MGLGGWPADARHSDTYRPAVAQGPRRAQYPARRPGDAVRWPVLHLWEFQKPTISAVHGYCVGGGTYFGLLNDIVVASEDAYFQMPLPQGLGFPGGETMIEPWVMMNFHQAYEYLYLSPTVDAREAHRLGMVNRVVAREDLDDTVGEPGERLRHVTAPGGSQESRDRRPSGRGTVPLLTVAGPAGAADPQAASATR
jgi:enoyl-CoA hydratase/carnithine racemase